MKLILVRHGETDWNKERRYQGQTDLEMNETGKRQVKMLGNRLVDTPIDLVYVSDLKRAMVTAQIITRGRDIVMEVRQELREINFGEFEGKTFEEIEAIYPDWVPTNFDFTSYQGESLEQVTVRIKTFLSELSERDSSEQAVLVVGHGGALRVMLCILLGIDVSKWWQISLDTVSMTTIEGDAGQAVLRQLNDTCHLEGTLE